MLIIANGFSCREQIAQNTRRSALHLAGVLQMALREGLAGPDEKYPERGYIQRNGGGPTGAELGVFTAGSLLLVGLWYQKYRSAK
ncbi:MAG TPA: hypothetical protein VFJ52_13210 [Terriglobia bacterium]|nr:hypothetical protein [Terriglobia bacterium]